jgi:hypothetical protein
MKTPSTFFEIFFNERLTKYRMILVVNHLRPDISRKSKPGLMNPYMEFKGTNQGTTVQMAICDKKLNLKIMLAH